MPKQQEEIVRKILTYVFEFLSQIVNANQVASLSTTFLEECKKKKRKMNELKINKHKHERK